MNATLLAEHHAASVLINSAHQILYVNGSADDYLGQPVGEPTGNILDIAREGLRVKLRIALRRAVQSQSGTPISEVVSNGEGQTVKITITQLVDPALSGKALLVIFARMPVPDRTASPVPSGVDSDLWHLESELRTTQTALGGTIQELEESNSDLRVSNEEILSMNEELRSANEELETSKEELQALNEQLSQMNSQLEHKIHQLEALTEDVTNLLASTAIPTVLIDRNGLIKRFTPNATSMFGLARSDVGRTIADVLVTPLGDALMGDVERVLSGVMGHAEREVEAATGQWYVRRVTPYITLQGRPPAGAVLTWTDISHVKRSDEQSRRLAAVVQDSNDAITVFDLKGRFLAWNKAATGMYGYDAEEAMQMFVSDMVPSGARQDHLDFILHASHHEAQHSYETRRVGKDGRVIDIWLTMSILSDDAGNPTAVVSTERDITDRNVSNAQLRERAAQLALADRRKNEFLAMLGHELRNPLAALCSAGNLLASQAVADSQKAWAAGVIQRQGRAMMHLVNDMLDIARITSGSIELSRQTVSLKTVVQSAVEVCQPIVDERRHSLSVSLPDEPVILYADPTRLSQVIENIVINAAKFTAPGGGIKLKATTTADRVSLSIKDNGRGIPTAMLGSLFDMFVQGPASGNQRHNGLGVGLSVVRRLVELHGGSVRAISDGMAGSEFVVELPLGATTSAANAANVSPAPPVLLPKRILVIDDNADASEALAMLLAIGNHQVQTCRDGISGIAAAATFGPDVVLLDIGLPDMDGYEVARKLRESETNQNVILIAITGYGMPSDRVRSAEAGFDHHLTKPVDPEELIRLFGTPTERVSGT